MCSLMTWRCWSVCGEYVSIVGWAVCASAGHAVRVSTHTLLVTRVVCVGGGGGSGQCMSLSPSMRSGI